MDKYGTEKVIVPDRNVSQDKMLMSWGSPYEIWLLSTIERDTTYSIVISDDVGAISWGRFYSDGLLTTWGLYHYNELDHRYFKFADSVSTYIVVK